MKKLCTKSGCGVCLDCTLEFKETVFCRINIAEHVECMQETIEDMVQYIFRNCERFDSKNEVWDYFNINDIYNADDYYKQ